MFAFFRTEAAKKKGKVIEAHVVSVPYRTRKLQFPKLVFPTTGERKRRATNLWTAASAAASAAASGRDLPTPALGCILPL